MPASDAPRDSPRPRAAELRNVGRACARSPRVAVGLASDLLLAGLPRARAAAGRRLAWDVHRTGKRSVPGLPRVAMVPSQAVSAELTFPRYPPAISGAHVREEWTATIADDRSDMEAYFARHRWAGCITALLGDEADAARAVAACADWMSRCPTRSDAAWEPYSASERVANLLVLLAAQPSARGVILHERVRGFVEESLVWIASHLEYYGEQRTNNHILNNARALLIGGSVCGSAAYVELGAVLFSEMAARLFQAGGFLRERSSHYQLLVTNWILDARHFGRATRQASARAREALDRLDAITERVRHASILLERGLGSAETFIGDISPDCRPPLTRARLARLYPDWAPPAAPPAGQRVDDWVVLHHGDASVVSCTIPETFPLAFPTHGHSDLGHFVWRVGPRLVLSDAGRGRYLADEPFLAQVDARGHNVMLVEEMGPLAESLVGNGRLYPRTYASARVATTAGPGAHFTVRHSGFTRIRGVGSHTRTVRLTDDGVVIDDTIEGSGRVTVDMLWHFGPGFAAVAPHVASHAGASVACVFESADAPVPETSWESYAYSPAYGKCTEAAVLRSRWQVRLPCAMRTSLTLRESAVRAPFA